MAPFGSQMSEQPAVDTLDCCSKDDFQEPSHNLGTANSTDVPRIYERPQEEGLSAYVKSDTSDYTRIRRPTFYVTFQTPTSQL